MIKTTQWKPLECNCVLEYTWDSNTTEDARVHTVSSHRHCGGDHPHAVIGETLEKSDFLAHHVKTSIKIGG